jgi:hypothetical protein
MASNQRKFCNHNPPSTPQTSTLRGRGYVAVVDGRLSGLIRKSSPVRTISLSSEIDPTRIPSDAIYRRELLRKSNDEPLSMNSTEKLRRLREVYDPELTARLPNSLILAAHNKLSSHDIAAFGKALEEGGNSDLPYFFYGSAMFPAVIKQIANLPGDLRSIIHRMTPGLLIGYTRHAVCGKQSFPAIIPSGSSKTSVTGMICFGIKDMARPRIHAFESGMFELRRVSVLLEVHEDKTKEIECGVYIWKGQLANLEPLEEKEWTLRDLMESTWHLGNLERFEQEDRLL